MPRKKLSLIEELKRRKVGRAIMAWAGSAVFVKEGVEIMGPVIGLSDAGVRVVFFLVLLSFPAFLFFAWTFEISEDGIEVTDEVDDEATPAELAERNAAAKKRGWLAPASIFVFLVLGTFYVLDPGGSISTIRSELATRFWNGINVADVSGPMVEGGVQIDASLTLTFTGEVDPRSASSENIQLVADDGTLVPAVVSVSAGGDEIIVDPTQRLRYGADYTVRVTEDLRASDGREVWNPERTGPGSEFVVRTQPIPAGGVRPRAALGDGFNTARAPRSGPIPIAFDGPIDPSSAEQGIRIVDASGETVPVRILTEAGNQGVRLEPTSALQRGSVYTIIVDSTLMAENGLTAVAASFEFTVTPPAPAAATTPAAARPTPPPANPTGPGQLTLTIVPASAAEFVKVVVNGDTIAQPVSGFSLQQGRSHLIRVIGVPELSAYTIPVFERSVRVEPGQRYDIQAEITAFGSVDIASQPAGTVFIDGREVGRTPLAGYPITAGVIHSLEIRPLAGDADSYDAFTGDIRVSPLEWRSLGRLQLPPKGLPRR